MDKLRYELDEAVMIEVTHERGTVIGRAEYHYCEPQYLIRYKGNDGTAHENWWTESALTK